MEALIFYIIGAVLLSFDLYMVVRNAVDNSILKDITIEKISSNIQSLPTFPLGVFSS